MAENAGGLDMSFAWSGNSPEYAAGRSAMVVMDLGNLRSHADRADLTADLNPYEARIENIVVPNAIRLVRAFRQAGGVIVFTRVHFEHAAAHDWPVQYRRHVMSVLRSRPADSAFAFNPRIEHQDGDIEISKKAVSAFVGAHLAQALQSRGVTHLFFAGAYTNMAVGNTATDAANLGYRVTVIEDACAGPTDEIHEGYLKNQRWYFDLASTDEVLGLVQAAR